MGAAKPTPATAPVLRADTRKVLLDLVDRGCRVKVTPDGTIHIDPPKRDDDGDPFDTVDMRA